MGKRYLSSFIDLMVVLIFSVLFWAVLENASGTLFNVYFIDEIDTAKNIQIFLTIYLSLSFIYHAVLAVKGISLGKRLTGVCIENFSIGRKRLVVKELVLKWLIFFALPILLMFVNLKMGITFFFVLVLGYILLSLLFWRKTRAMLIDRLSGIKIITTNNQQPSTQNNYWLSISALFIDISIVFCLTTVVHALSYEFFYFEYFIIFFAIAFIYLMLTAFTQGLTCGKLMLGFRITKDEIPLKTFDVIKREILFKYIPIFVIPYIFLRILGINDPYCIFLNIITIMGFVAILYFTLYGEMWWSKLLRTKKRVEKTSFFNTTLVYIMLLSIWIVSYFFVQTKNNKFQESKITFCGFEYPFKFQTAKSTKVAKYVTFLSKQHELPKDYILNLYKKYDIVVL